MPEITKQVKFDNIAREWRCKWSADSDKKSLDELQAALDEVLPTLSGIDGCDSVQRVVCGGCLDFKVVTKLKAKDFAKWEENKFAPEADFLAAAKKIAGVTAVETQTYTLEEVKMNKKAIAKALEKKEKEEEKPKEEKKPEESPEEARKKKLKKVIKEGGKRGVEIEGAADMGGLQFFCTAVDEPEGDLELLKECVKAMNQENDPTNEERKGCSGHIGKMIFSAGADQLGVLAYVPADKQAELDCADWLEKVLGLFGGQVVTKGKDISSGFVKADGDKNIFPLKIREPMILEANNILRKKGLFPEDNDDSDEMVFGDDDFPS